MRITESQLRRIVREEIDNESMEDSDEPRPFQKYEENPYIVAVMNAADPKELAAAKKKFVKDDDNYVQGVPSAGAFFYFYEIRKKELANMNTPSSDLRAHRIDTILNIRDSTGKATRRKF